MPWITNQILFEGQSFVNLPNTATVPENSNTGTVIFTLQGAAQFVLINQYPAVTSEAFQYDAKGKFQQIVNTFKNNGDNNID